MTERDMKLCIAGLALTLSAVGCAASKDKPTSTSANEAASEVVTEAPRVPGSHNNGMAKFKDPGVYLDGIPIGMLTFGELPAPLHPVWHEERAAVPFGPGSTGPRYRIVKQRRYRFADYLEALGVELEAVKELHIYGGGKKAAAVIVSGEDLRTHRDFTFRFGGDVYGKPLPSCPEGLGDGKCPDQIAAVTIYSKRKPPTRDGGYFVLDGQRVKGIPYYGEPLRGGVRVYMDGPLATVIKRNRLMVADVEPIGSAGQEKWQLFAFLESQGVDTDKIKEAWIIHKGKRVQRLPRSAIVSATFEANQAGSGEILLGESRIPANAIALQSTALDPADLPVIQPGEGDS